MKVKVVNKNYIESSHNEIIVEITVITKFWLFNITRKYRKVHGDFFYFENGTYTLLEGNKKKRVESWFRLPSEDSLDIN